MRTTAEITVHHTAGMQEGHPFSNVQSGLQNCLHAGGRHGGRGRPEHAFADGHLRDMSQFLRAGRHLQRPCTPEFCRLSSFALHMGTWQVAW